MVLKQNKFKQNYKEVECTEDVSKYEQKLSTKEEPNKFKREANKFQEFSKIETYNKSLQKLFQIKNNFRKKISRTKEQIK